MLEKKNFLFKVPKTKSKLIKEILKRWWYAKDFKEQARRAFGYCQISGKLHQSKSKGKPEKPEAELNPPEIGSAIYQHVFNKE